MMTAFNPQMTARLYNSFHSQSIHKFLLTEENHSSTMLSSPLSANGENNAEAEYCTCYTSDLTKHKVSSFMLKDKFFLSVMPIRLYFSYISVSDVQTLTPGSRKNYSEKALYLLDVRWQRNHNGHYPYNPNQSTPNESMNEPVNQLVD
jgi:hypothetical protein